MSGLFKWNGKTTSRAGLMLRPGQVFDPAKYPALDILAELESGRVSKAGEGEELTFVSPEERLRHEATVARNKALDEKAALLQSEHEAKVKFYSDRNEQFEKDKALLQSEREAFELEKKSFFDKSTSKKKRGSK